MIEKFFETEIIEGYEIKAHEKEDLKSYLFSQKTCDCDWDIPFFQNMQTCDKCENPNDFYWALSLFEFRHYGDIAYNRDFICVFRFKKFFKDSPFVFFGNKNDLLKSERFEIDKQVIQEAEL